MTPPTTLVNDIFANQVSWLRNINAEVPPQPSGRSGDISPHVVFSGSCVVTVASENDVLSDALATLRQHDQSSILAWAARLDPTTDLRLHARGFRESFAPAWMWHDLSDIPPFHDCEVVISAATDADRAAYVAAPGVPYINSATSGGILDRILRDQPRTTMLLAWSGDSVIGTGAVHLSDANQGPVAGVYNIAVAPAWRRRGIATAIAVRLLHLTRDQGAVGACLNATPDGRRVYQKAGFREAGQGQTWFMQAGMELPPADVVAAGEALGRGDVRRLDPATAKHEEMPNGESPIRYAARFGQDAAIRWLLDRGAIPDITPLWRHGFRIEAVAAMRDPASRDRLWGTPGVTALHDAVYLDDEGLVRALIDAGANLSARDGKWESTPARWATELGRDAIAGILAEAGGATEAVNPG